MKHLLFLCNIIDRAHTIGHCRLWRILGSVRNHLILCGHRAEFHNVSALASTLFARLDTGGATSVGEEGE
jgi:hypothetical protein